MVEALKFEHDFFNAPFFTLSSVFASSLTSYPHFQVIDEDECDANLPRDDFLNDWTINSEDKLY